MNNISIPNKNNVNLGKYILDSLAVGMYNDPLMILREYVQNSVDSLDTCRSLNLKYFQPRIDVTIDGRKKSICVYDNGIGVPSEKARNILLDIGYSEKDPNFNRGFRGIGRLGGLGFCDELVFSTKSTGEKIESRITWNCQQLKKLISDNNARLDINSLIMAISVFEQYEYKGSSEDHFFKVEMNSINDGRNQLINVPEIRNYISQVAPVPFNTKYFRFGAKIDQILRDKIRNYQTYDIYINGQQIFKPYLDEIRLSKESVEKINEVKFVELIHDSGMLGFGWIAELSLQGSVNPISGSDGMRLRIGNILLGNKESLSGFFRERRFNNYLVGEMHVAHIGLIPNSRRDDLEDNIYKTAFANAFIREIGIPISRTIRFLSNKRSKERCSSSLDHLFKNAQTIIEKGYISDFQRDEIRQKLLQVNGSSTAKEKFLAGKLAEQLLTAQHILDNKTAEVSSKVLFKRTLQIMYQNIKSRSDSEQLISKIYQEITG